MNTNPENLNNLGTTPDNNFNQNPQEPVESLEMTPPVQEIPITLQPEPSVQEIPVTLQQEPSVQDTPVTLQPEPITPEIPISVQPEPIVNQTPNQVEMNSFNNQVPNLETPMFNQTMEPSMNSIPQAPTMESTPKFFGEQTAQLNTLPVNDPIIVNPTPFTPMPEVKNPTSEPIAPKKNKTLTFVILIILLAILAGGGYYVYITYFQNDPVVNPTPTNNEILTKAKETIKSNPDIYGTGGHESVEIIVENNTITYTVTNGEDTASCKTELVDNVIKLNISIEDINEEMSEEEFGRILMCGIMTSEIADAAIANKDGLEVGMVSKFLAESDDVPTGITYNETDTSMSISIDLNVTYTKADFTIVEPTEYFKPEDIAADQDEVDNYLALDSLGTYHLSKYDMDLVIIYNDLSVSAYIISDNKEKESLYSIYSIVEALKPDEAENFKNYFKDTSYDKLDEFYVLDTVADDTKTMLEADFNIDLDNKLIVTLVIAK